MPTRDKVIPGNWASVQGGKWHVVTQDRPAFRQLATSLCGLTFEPFNVTRGEAPPTNDRYICCRCTATLPAETPDHD